MAAPRELTTAASVDAVPSPIVAEPAPPVPAPSVGRAETATHADTGDDERGDSPLAAALPFLPRIAAAAAALVLLVVGGRYVLGMLSTRQSSEPAATSPASPAPSIPSSSARKATGVLRVNSTPTGAQVLIDGKERGVTPLALDDVPAGAHTVEIVSTEGTIRRAVTIAADHPTDLTESIFSGWVAIHAPFDLSVTEGTRALRADDRGQILLPPGRHDLRLVNRTLGYDQVHHVEVKPGEIAALDIASPRSTLNVTASEPAEVLVDGVRVGETPLSDAPIDVGTREIVVKRASGGQRRVTATVTTKPYTLNVDFSR